MNNQTGNWNFLVSWLKSQREEGPIIISGHGAREMAFKLLTLARCMTEDREPCLKCHGCKSAIQSDEIHISSENKTISIDEVRKIITALRYSSLSNIRTILVQEVERLTQPAANALLKSFEESDKHTRFILTSVAPRRLMSTILSRSQHVRLGYELLRSDNRTSTIMHDTAFNRLINTDLYTNSDFMELLPELLNKIRKYGPTNSIKIAMTRLRDYYRIKATNGNLKLAKEVLLASLPNIDT